jgi:hypothetical protein
MQDVLTGFVRALRLAGVRRVSFDAGKHPTIARNVEIHATKK